MDVPYSEPSAWFQEALVRQRIEGDDPPTGLRALQVVAEVAVLGAAALDRDFELPILNRIEERSPSSFQSSPSDVPVDDSLAADTPLSDVLPVGTPELRLQNPGAISDDRAPTISKDLARRCISLLLDTVEESLRTS